MIGNIYITGQIGTFDGVKGVELQDVVSQYESMKDYERVNVHINSNGGLVVVGTAIHNYLSKFSNVYTIAKDTCASIATKIHLSVPVERRSIQKGCDYFIHAPLITDISGNSDELKTIASELEYTENDLVSMYVKATGTSKEGIQALVKQETSLTEDQVISLGFASEIIEPTILRAVAFIERKNNNENSLIMFKKQLKNLATKIAIKMNVDPKELIDDSDVADELQRNELNMVIKTDKGEITTMYDDVMVGDSVTIDGKTPDAGDYVAEDGTMFTIDDTGVIVNIVLPTAEETVPMAKYNELEAKVKELEAKNIELEADSKLALETLEKIEAMKSNHVPNTKAYRPEKKNVPTVKESYKDILAKRKEAAKNK